MLLCSSFCCSFFIFFLNKMLSLIRKKCSLSGNYGPISEWPEPLLPPTGISKVLFSVFASNFWSSSTWNQAAAAATALYILLHYELQCIFIGVSRIIRPRQNFFSLWVLKPHELTRFIEAISSYQWIFEQASYEGFSPLKHTDFIQRIVLTAYSCNNLNCFLQCE